VNETKIKLLNINTDSDLENKLGAGPGMGAMGKEK